MNPLFVLTALFASAFAAPTATLLHGAPLAHAAPLAGTHHIGTQLVGSDAAPVATPLHQRAAPVGHIPAVLNVPPPHFTHQKAADVTTIHKPDPIVTKQVHLGQTSYVSGYNTQILKPAIPDFKIAVPTALKGSVAHTAPVVSVEKEIHVVKEPVHVEVPYDVPYDVIKHVEQIVEVPAPYHVAKPVAVPHPVPVAGAPIIKKVQGPPVVRHHHHQHVAQPLLHHAPLAHAAHFGHAAFPLAAAPVATTA